jgi:hypothetical protein
VDQGGNELKREGSRLAPWGIYNEYSDLAAIIGVVEAPVGRQAGIDGSAVAVCGSRGAWATPSPRGRRVPGRGSGGGVDRYRGGSGR